VLRKFVIHIFLTIVFVQASFAQSKKDYLVTIHTTLGDLQMVLFDETPLHKANFIAKAQLGKYNGTSFFLNKKDEFIVGGDSLSRDADPSNDGTYFTRNTIKKEIVTKYSNKFAFVGAWQLVGYKNPGASSDELMFYIITSKKGMPQLDGKYTVFGVIVSGLEVLDKINASKVDANNHPIDKIFMNVSLKQVKKARIRKILKKCVSLQNN
jgi:cyclophilin family peptidyl-prolyl cis-trans isomerase